MAVSQIVFITYYTLYIVKVNRISSILKSPTWSTKNINNWKHKRHNKGRLSLRLASGHFILSMLSLCILTSWLILHLASSRLDFHQRISSWKYFEEETRGVVWVDAIPWNKKIITRAGSEFSEWMTQNVNRDKLKTSCTSKPRRNEFRCEWEKKSCWGEP